jgi:hypothetical protein
MFNNVKLLEDMRKVHLQSNEEFTAFNAVTDVRNRLNDITLCGFVGDQVPLINRSLDDICANFVGETMFRLLIAKIDPPKLKITNIALQEEQKEIVKQRGSSYSSNGVKINLNLYDDKGIGNPKRQYYGITVDHVSGKKLKSVKNSLFHEFTHCLHSVEDRCLYKNNRKIPNHKKYIWGNFEELRTITGYMDPDIYDPICENCFDLHSSVLANSPYVPRIGHFGYKEGLTEYPESELQQFYKNLLFDLAWPQKYA